MQLENAKENNADILGKEPDMVIAYLSLAQESRSESSKFAEIKSICVTKVSSAGLKKGQPIQMKNLLIYVDK